MDKKKIVMLFVNHKTGKEMDVEVPVDITASEFIVGLNTGLSLGLNVEDAFQCHLSAENPIVLVRGNKTLEQLGLHDGTVIHYK